MRPIFRVLLKGRILNKPKGRYFCVKREGVWSSITGIKGTLLFVGEVKRLVFIKYVVVIKIDNWMSVTISLNVQWDIQDV